MIHVVEPWRLAKEFSRIISDWLTPEQLAEANRLNKTPEYTANSLCATHNYRDSNQAMIDALAQFGVDWDSDNIDLCNAAWSLAKEADFNPDHVRVEMDGLKRYTAVCVNAAGANWRAKTEAGEPYSYADWFVDDVEAETGYRSLMEGQGYKVVSVKIGFPCVVTLQ